MTEEAAAACVCVDGSYSREAVSVALLYVTELLVALLEDTSWSEVGAIIWHRPCAASS